MSNSDTVRTTVSIALGTYNGERYLREQLQSLADQERLPDELVVSDDASTDGTLAVVHAFASDAPFKINVLDNRENLGVAGNFTRCVKACTGDWVFPCDQDDIWQPQKIARMMAALSGHGCGNAKMLLCDTTFMDDAGQPLPGTQWQRLGFGRSRRISFLGSQAFELLLAFNVATGAAMAVRKDVVEQAMPVPSDWIHDDWLALFAAAMGHVAIVDEPLVKYRQHGSQEIGGAPRGLLRQWRYATQHMGGDYFDRQVARWTEARDRLSPIVDETRRRLLDEKLKHMERRRNIHQRGVGRMPAVLREAMRGNYERFGYGWKSLAQDLLM